jgi:hypothetical protein
MRRRPLALLLIATVSGLAAAGVSDASSPKASVAPARIPALPAVAEATVVHRVWHASPCPIPPAWRGAFERASRDVGLPLAMLVAVAQVERASSRAPSPTQGRPG